MSYMWLDGDCAQLCEAVRTGTSSDIQLLVETRVDVDAQDRVRGFLIHHYCEIIYFVGMNFRGLTILDMFVDT